MRDTGRKIHISISEELHKRVRIRCACEDTTIQNYVERLIESDMASYAPTDALASTAIGGSSLSKQKSGRRSRG